MTHPLLKPKTLSLTNVVLTVLFSVIAGSYAAALSMVVWP